MTRISLGRIGAAAAIAVAVACTGSGCAVIPLSGPYTAPEVGGGDPLSKPFQRLIATEPQRDWGPEETIRGLQAAMAAYADDPTMLPRYLTPDALAGWTPSGPVTVVDDAPTWQFVPRDGTEAVQEITLKARQVARIDEDGTYVPLSGTWERPFELVKTQGSGYRVRSLPDGLVLTRSDVERAYRATKLYYLNGRTQNRLVVDNVRLRLKPTENYARVILERLLKAPSAALQGAATTSFPTGTKIESVRWSSEERVVINLSGPLDPLDLGTEAAVMAQIRYSLNNNDVAKGRSIEVLVNGEPYSSYQPNSDQHWLDNGGNTPFYVSKGAVHYMTTEGPGGAVPGPAGQPHEGYSDFAVSKQGVGKGDNMIAAKTSTGISVASLAREGQWQEVIQGSPEDLTAPSWHRDGSLWTFDRKNGVVLRYDPASGRGPERVAAPGLKGLDVTNLRISRDGVRVAVTTGKNTVQLGALTDAGGLMLSNFRLLTSTVVGDEIKDVAWRDDEHLLVLVEGKAGQVLNEIDIGDGEISEIPRKATLKSVAALNDRVLAEADADKGKGTEIVELGPDQTWTSKITSEATTPIFPLG